MWALSPAPRDICLLGKVGSTPLFYLNRRDWVCAQWGRRYTQGCPYIAPSVDISYSEWEHGIHSQPGIPGRGRAQWTLSDLSARSQFWVKCHSELVSAHGIVTEIPFATCATCDTRGTLSHSDSK